MTEINKKILIIILGVFIIIFASFYSIRYIIDRNTPSKLGDVGDGSVVYTPRPEDVKLGDAIQNLQKKLPFVIGSFAITQFDYKTAKFVVELKGITQIEFFDWLKTSEFSPIPQKRFLIKKP